VSHAAFLLMQLAPHVLLTAVGIGFFTRHRTFPTALASLGFLLAVVGDIGEQLSWTVAVWARLVGVWVGSLALLWHVLSTRKRDVP